jgi:PqqD family protein of HPr-rel-A system
MGEACVRVNAPQVIHESIDGEVIVIDLGTGTYYSLKGSGAAIWDALDRAGAATAAELAGALAARYEVDQAELEAAIGGLLTDLSAEGLVVAASEGDTVSSPSRANGGEANGAFEPPRLEKFTDMQDLVLLDPVHEVDATGWPQRRPDDAAAA